MTARSIPQTGDNFLRRVLRANAAFSGVSGAAFLLGARPLSDLFGLAAGAAPLVFAATGAVLLAYAAVLFAGAARQALDRQLVLIAAILDTVWVAGGVAGLLAGWPEISRAGWWISLIVDDVVGLFAVLEWYGLWRTRGR